MLFQIKSYFKFLIKSTNAHGVHSPFVFDLVTKCFYDKADFPLYSVLDDYRQALLADTASISVTDFGAGSRVFKSNSRSVSKIAKTAGITPARARLLFRIVHYFKPKNILEIGTSVGLATSALSLGNLSAKIITLEGCPETSAVAQGQLKKFEIGNVTPIVTEFAAFLNEIPLHDQHASKFDLIYFDGNHTKAATLDYFEKLLPTVTNDSCWIFDDIHWSADMEAAWDIIKKHPQVTVTIDTYQWGFVFFRKEQKKEDFVIRV